MLDDENIKIHREENRPDRKRVHRIKKAILFVFVGMLLLSFVLNIILLCKVYKLEHKMSELYSDTISEVADGGLSHEFF